MPINVRLLDHTSDPTRSLYVAYRTAYSALTPQKIVDQIASEKITRAQMEELIEKRLETGHASPLEQVSSPQQKLPGTVGTVVHSKPFAVQRESAQVTGFEPPPSPQQ